jgi:chromosome segregation and condensation protein ScpB
MTDFIDLFEGRLTRKQVRYMVEKLVEKKDLRREGEGKGTIYSVGENYIKTMSILSKAIDIGIKQLKDKGEL